MAVIATTLSVVHPATPVHAASDITIDLNSTKQSIRGFGGMNHPLWISDLTDSQRTTAFGNGDGQMGLSILRIHVDENSSNWSRELATAKRAGELGATVFASPWNPPSSMTEVVNGQKRLRYNQYAAYANHLNSFVSYMKQNGVDLYAISVQNEPDYAAEWTAWTPQEMLNFMRSNAGSIQTRVIAPESFQYRKTMSDPILNDSQALANMDILGAHLYGTQLSAFPYPLFKQKGQGKELWMTEVYTESQNDADAWPLALDVAYNIHNSMVEAEFNAYVWWYIRRSYGLLKENGQISKRGYAMTHFSKFIRPGAVRVDATKNPTSDVYVSSYKSGQNLVTVVVNRSSSAKTLSLGINGGSVASMTKYTTSGSKSLKNDGTISASNGGFSLSLDGQSVTTFVGALGGTAPTATPVPPTATRTATAVPTATRTAVPGTATPVVPTATPAAPTATPAGPTSTPLAGTGCQVTYTVNQWGTGFTADVTIKNTGSTAINGWALAWTFSGDQQISGAWNATISPTSGSVVASNMSYNAAIAPGGSASFGFQATYSGTNATPAFTLNGTPCS
ncbi:cellulose-binding protein [Chloroflexia bacterium SDU3-3]|nr:cellulose-binding protein [Chloroflexia bacterium SDU3-3]